MDNELLKLMHNQNIMLEKMLEKTAASGETAGRLHGRGGIFSTPGLDRDIITAHVRPYGIAKELPSLPTYDEDPRYGAITGFSDDIGDEPDEVCDDAPTGYMKACNLTAMFGMLRRDTDTIDMGRVGMRINRGDFRDLILRGQVLGMSGLEPKGLKQNQILDLLVMSEMVDVGVRVERELGKRIWQGSIALKQMPGLDYQIATGQMDADTATLCPAMDSQVMDFNYTIVGDASRSIVRMMSQMHRILMYKAETQGLQPLDLVLAMREDLFWELTEIWPCEYNTNKCASAVVGDQSRVFIDGRQNIEERDRWRNNKELPINGVMVPVITDTGIYEDTNITKADLAAGQYASTVYFLPLKIRGNFPVLYREYLDYKGGIAMAENKLLKGMQNFWSDDGKFLWALEQEKYCVKLAARTEQRIVLRTPHLAGRIDHVAYEPLKHLPETDPTSPYWEDGGVSLRDHSQGYSVWNPTRIAPPK